MSLQSLSYQSRDDHRIYTIIDTIGEGIDYASFKAFSQKLGFSIRDWSKFLHLSERTFQRYEKESRTFDTLQSQQIVEIAMLFSHGCEVFDTEEIFAAWLDTQNLALGNIKPKDLMETSFGINLIHDELTRIEYGVLA